MNKKMSYTEDIMAGVEFKNKELREKVGEDADKKFGNSNSYVKNLWILREYKKRGGAVVNTGKKPSDKKIKEQVKS